MAFVRFSSDAATDVNEIYDYIAEQAGERRAQHWLADVQTLMELLAENPGAGRSRSELGEGLRSFPAGNYTILYVERFRGIEIARMFHSARNLDTLFP